MGLAELTEPRWYNLSQLGKGITLCHCDNLLCTHHTNQMILDLKLVVHQGQIEIFLALLRL